MEVEVIVSDTETTGQRGLFDLVGRGSKVAQKRVAEVSATFRDFCRAFSENLNSAEEILGKYQLEKIEMSVELTVKGEVRIIASASAETKGSVKLIFSRQP